MEAAFFSTDGVKIRQSLGGMLMSAVSGIGAGEFVITTSTKPIEAGTQVKLADNG